MYAEKWMSPTRWTTRRVRILGTVVPQDRHTTTMRRRFRLGCCHTVCLTWYSTNFRRHDEVPLVSVTTLWTDLSKQLYKDWMVVRQVHVGVEGDLLQVMVQM